MWDELDVTISQQHFLQEKTAAKSLKTISVFGTTFLHDNQTIIRDIYIVSSNE